MFISSSPFNSGVYTVDERNQLRKPLVNWLDCSKQQDTKELQQNEVWEGLFKIRTLHPVTRDVVSLSQTGIIFYMATAQRELCTDRLPGNLIQSDSTIGCIYTTAQRELCTDRLPENLIQSDTTIGCIYTTVSSWRWALEAQNM